MVYVHAMVVVETTWLFKNLRKLRTDVRTIILRDCVLLLADRRDYLYGLVS